MGNTYESDVAFIRALAEILRESDLSEIEVKRDYGEEREMTVRIARQAPVAAPAVLHHAHVAPPPVPLTVAGAAAEIVRMADDPALHPGAVPSPMVGTVYLQAEPGTPAFVKVGDVVAEGQTLLIIEAMKTMNQIPAPRSGTVRRILVDDGTPVEYGTPLMIVE